MLIVLGMCCVGLFCCCVLLFNKNRAYRQDLSTRAQTIAIYAEHNRTLIKELNHRVKNTLQLFQSLLNLERRRSNPADSELRLFRAFNARLKTLALISNDLYRDGLPHRVDLVQLLEGIVSSSEINKDNPVIVAGQSAPIDLDTANVLGLIVCEILLILSTHESHESLPRPIRISLNHGEGILVLNIEAQRKIGLTNYQPGSIGKTIVTGLIEQIGAELEVRTSGDGGPTFFQISLSCPD